MKKIERVHFVGRLASASPIPREFIADRTEFALRETDFIPHAIINEGIKKLSARCGARVISAHDDLDRFQGSLVYVGSTTVALKHYAGHPKGTTTIYFSSDIAGREPIARQLDATLAALRVPANKVRWRRCANSPGPAGNENDDTDFTKYPTTPRF